MNSFADDDETRTETDPAVILYLDLLCRCLTRSIYPDLYRPLNLYGRRRFIIGAFRLLEARNIYLTRREDKSVVQSRSIDGTGWPQQAETMIGLRRLEQLAGCVGAVVREEVPGDVIETGVWRGGATILMRGVLKAMGDTSRTVWVADSFRGLPPPNAQEYKADMDDRHWQYPELAISLEEVKDNFSRYGLLDDQVRFLVGWFSDTLPTAPIERLSVLRLDGDMYESTMDALAALYPKLSLGGYVIIDDYGAIPACRQAVHDYRSLHGITENIVEIDWTGVFWRRQG